MTSSSTSATSPSRGDPLGFIADEIADLKAKHLYRPLRVMSAAQGPVTTVDGRAVISLSSNDYLGLTHHPRLREAALAAVRDFGVGSGAVRTIAGTMSVHEALESDLAEFKHTEAVLTFQSGFTANSGVIPVVTGDQDLILSDGRTVWQQVAELVAEWGADLVGEHGLSAVGAVIGATHPRAVGEARRLLPRSILLLPGVGAQGATPADVARAFTSGPASALVSVSRNVIYAFRVSGMDWRSAAAAEASKYAREVWSVSGW